MSKPMAILVAGMALSLSGCGRHAFVTNTYANTVSVIDVAERKGVTTVPVGKRPLWHQHGAVKAAQLPEGETS